MSDHQTESPAPAGTRDPANRDAGKSMFGRPERIPLLRNPNTRALELCFPAWWKWAAGILATLTGTAVIGMVSMLINLNTLVHIAIDRQSQTITRLKDVEDKLDEVRTDAFSGTDAERMEGKIMAEINRRHR